MRFPPGATRATVPSHSTANLPTRDDGERLLINRRMVAYLYLESSIKNIYQEAWKAPQSVRTYPIPYLEPIRLHHLD